MAREFVWTDAAFELLFEQTVKQFGPYREWCRPNYPGRVEDESTEAKFRCFLEAFAVVVGAKSADAVGMILMIAAKPKLNNPHGRSEDILAAALKARFIDASNINGEFKSKAA